MAEREGDCHVHAICSGRDTSKLEHLPSRARAFRTSEVPAARPSTPPAVSLPNGSG
jgi:hypothetical protein